MLKSEAIKQFLTDKTHADLAKLYNVGMECQVNVHAADGERIKDEYKGVTWNGYTDGINTWKPFRIPYKADTTPEYDDREMGFALSVYADAIGMTGWDWQERCSKWVAFDFDAIVGHSESHSKVVTLDQMIEIREAAEEIEWVTLRHSTSGKGLHLYVFVDDVPTANHTEHAGLARAVLSEMSALVGYDFSSKVDICGGNMWVWARKMEGEGLKLIKQGTVKENPPHEWRKHIGVTRGSQRKIKHKLGSGTIEEKFDTLNNQSNRVKLDSEHKRLIHWLSSEGRFFWWDADHHMLVTHTKHLMDAHEGLLLRGVFKSNTNATNIDEQNCFLYPMRKGAWSVRRYGMGTNEHTSWEQDGHGWTKCYYNRDPEISTAARTYNGVEDPKGGFVFNFASDVVDAASVLGATIEIPVGATGRSGCKLKMHKDNKRIIVEVPRETHDQQEAWPGWLQKQGLWVRIYSTEVKAATVEINAEDFDDIVRHLVSIDGSDSGWVINTDGHWHDEPLNHIRTALKSTGLKPPEVDQIIGGGVFKPWKLVTRPFQPEYTGDRSWNRKAPQFRVAPSSKEELKYNTWKMVLAHVGQSLDDAIKLNTWCSDYGIITGADYLKCWIAAMIQEPLQPLPYLFIYGDKQNTGKSIFHEALSLLFHPGYQRADQALKNSSFNAELEGAILCVVEETDLSTNAGAYARIKDWVTSPYLPIHRKGETPYHVPNTTHWVQCANSQNNCPIFSGDTRITVLHVFNPPENPIPKKQLIESLEREASDFLAAILALELPPTIDRLRLPVIETQDKVKAQEAQMSSLEAFIDEKCYDAPGYSISLEEFHKSFIAWLSPAERYMWNSKQSISKQMPDKYIKGKLTGDVFYSWGNISFSEPDEERRELMVIEHKLLPRML